MADEILGKLLAGASLRCVMQPDDDIPSNRPLHDECFNLPHVIIDGEKFSAITAGDIVTKPLLDFPIAFYYTNYINMFGSYAPVQVEPGYGKDKLIELHFSSRKRYKKFQWLTCGKWNKIWDSQDGQGLNDIRSEVLRAACMKVVFLDQADIWNIHPVILPQVATNENTFLLQTAYIAYPYLFRKTQEVMTLMEKYDGFRHHFEDRNCFDGMGGMQATPFYAFYHLYNNGTYKSYYDLSRGDTLNEYKRLMVFAEG